MVCKRPVLRFVSRKPNKRNSPFTELTRMYGMDILNVGENGDESRCLPIYLYKVSHELSFSHLA